MERKRQGRGGSRREAGGWRLEAGGRYLGRSLRTVVVSRSKEEVGPESRTDDSSQPCDQQILVVRIWDFLGIASGWWVKYGEERKGEAKVRHARAAHAAKAERVEAQSDSGEDVRWPRGPMAGMMNDTEMYGVFDLQSPEATAPLTKKKDREREGAVINDQMCKQN